MVMEGGRMGWARAVYGDLPVGGLSCDEMCLVVKVGMLSVKEVAIGGGMSYFPVLSLVLGVNCAPLD